MALGDRIRQLCKEAHWSQAKLGDEIGTSSQRASRYKTGKITPPLDPAVRTIQALNISLDHLLTGGVPRRTVHAGGHDPGDRLAAPDEVFSDDFASLLHMLDALVAKDRLKTLAIGIS